MVQGTTAHDCRMHAAAGLRLLCLPLHHSTRGSRSSSWCVAAVPVSQALFCPDADTFQFEQQLCSGGSPIIIGECAHQLLIMCKCCKRDCTCHPLCTPAIDSLQCIHCQIIGKRCDTQFLQVFCGGCAGAAHLPMGWPA